MYSTGRHCIHKVGCLFYKKKLDFKNILWKVSWKLDTRDSYFIIPYFDFHFLPFFVVTVWRLVQRDNHLCYDCWFPLWLTLTIVSVSEQHVAHNLCLSAATFSIWLSTYLSVWLRVISETLTHLPLFKFNVLLFSILFICPSILYFQIYFIHVNNLLFSLCYFTFTNTHLQKKLPHHQLFTKNIWFYIFN